MNRTIGNGLQSLILSEGCQSLSQQADTAWIFSFIEQHHIQLQTRDRDMWLFKNHPQLQATIGIWCIPKDQAEPQDQGRHWVVVEPRSLPEELEVLLFVKNSICYTFLDYFAHEFGEQPTHLPQPDLLFATE